MIIRTLVATLAGAALFGLTATSVVAQTTAPVAAAATPDAQAAPAKPKPKAKTSAGTATVAVTVTNSRKADLVQLQAAEPGSANWKKVLGPVKSGKQALAKLPQASDCHIDLHGTFADGQAMEASGVDVCTDKTINLTD